MPERWAGSTQAQTVPVIKTPSTGGAAQFSGTMPTGVQLTFSFEIASMQLTPTFKMGALQLRPTSKVVTMRLAPSQQPQPAVNLQVNFEISKIQPTGGGLGTIRLAPSYQQRPAIPGSPSFTVAGLRLVSNFDAAPVQLIPSAQAGVLITASFQIATVEFSPAFEIASIVLNASSKRVGVQLPGESPAQDVSTFEIANLQLGPDGELGLMQINLLSQGGAGMSAQPVRPVVHEPQLAAPGRAQIHVTAQPSSDRDLAAFSEVLRNHVDLLSQDARRLRVEFKMPQIGSFAEFAERSIEGTFEMAAIDISAVVGKDSDPDNIVFFALYRSKHIRQVTVQAFRKEGRLWATFPDPVILLDPAAPLEESDLAGLRGDFDLLPLYLPPPRQ